MCFWFDASLLTISPSLIVPHIMQFIIPDKINYSSQCISVVCSGGLMLSPALQPMLYMKNRTSEVIHAEKIVNCGKNINTFMFADCHCASQMTHLTATIWGLSCSILTVSNVVWSFKSYTLFPFFCSVGKKSYKGSQKWESLGLMMF